MNIYHKLDDIKINDIMFYKPTINKIAHYMYFYKVAYNIESFVLNTLFAVSEIVFAVLVIALDTLFAMLFTVSEIESAASFTDGIVGTLGKDGTGTAPFVKKPNIPTIINRIMAIIIIAGA